MYVVCVVCGVYGVLCVWRVCVVYVAAFVVCVACYVCCVACVVRVNVCVRAASLDEHVPSTRPHSRAVIQASRDRFP